MSSTFAKVSLVFLVLLFLTSSSSALAITGGGNITNLSITNAPIPGGAVNITGAGYYYFVPGVTGNSVINYTNETVDTSISIETSNVVLDCQYPSLGSNIIAGPRGNAANNPGRVVAGVVINATRTSNHLQNITVKNCIFTNFSTARASGLVTSNGTAILVVGNVTGLTLYNLTINSSQNGIVLSTNGTSGVFSGSWVNVNISTNRFFNLTERSGANLDVSAIRILTLYSDYNKSNALSLWNSTIEHNNLTSIGASAPSIYLFNVSNLTIYNNSIYNVFRGIYVLAANNSNISNNNITNIYYPTGASGSRSAIMFYNLSTGPSNGDLSGSFSTIANNWIYNVSMGIAEGYGIGLDVSNTNVTGNTINYTARGISDDVLSSYYLKFEKNTIGNATTAGIDISKLINSKLFSNVVLSSFVGIFTLTGTDGVSLVNNSITNGEYGMQLGYDGLGGAYNVTSQDDRISASVLAFSLQYAANFTAVNLSTNLSNISTAGNGPFNFTIRHPISISVQRAADSTPLSSASVSISALSTLPSGVGGVLNNSAVLDSSGTAHYNVTTFIAYLSHGSLVTYNFTPHTLAASLSGYFDNSVSATLPFGTFAAEQVYSIPLTAFAHSSPGSSSDPSTPAPVVEPVTPPAHEPEAPVTDSNPSNPSNPQTGRSSNIVDESNRVNQSSVSGQANVGAQAGSISLNLPVVGQVQVDPLVAVAVVVVIVLILLVVFGLM